MKNNKMEFDKWVQWQGDNFDECVNFCKKNDSEKKIIGFAIEPNESVFVISTNICDYRIDVSDLIDVIDGKLRYFEIAKFFKDIDTIEKSKRKKRDYIYII